MNRPIIVAEIGINHNGDLNIAKSLIAMSKNFGADFVKFQLPHEDVPVHRCVVLSLSKGVPVLGAGIREGGV